MSTSTCSGYRVQQYSHWLHLSKRTSIAVDRVIPRTSHKFSIVPRTSFYLVHMFLSFFSTIPSRWIRLNDPTTARCILPLPLIDLFGPSGGGRRDNAGSVDGRPLLTRFPIFDHCTHHIILPHIFTQFLIILHRAIPTTTATALERVEKAARALQRAARVEDMTAIPTATQHPLSSLTNCVPRPSLQRPSFQPSPLPSPSDEHRSSHDVSLIDQKSKFPRYQY